MPEHSDIDIAAADQARAFRNEALEQGDTKLAHSMDRLERNYLDGSGAEPDDGTEVAPTEPTGEPMPVADIQALYSQSSEGMAALELYPEFATEMPFAQKEGVALLSSLDEPSRILGRPLR